MALLKYIGPFEEVRVSVAGTDVGVVANGESLSVPDEVAALTEWPEDHWELMSKPKARSDSKTDNE